MAVWVRRLVLCVVLVSSFVAGARAADGDADLECGVCLALTSLAHSFKIFNGTQMTGTPLDTFVKRLSDPAVAEGVWLKTVSIEKKPMGTMLLLGEHINATASCGSDCERVAGLAKKFVDKHGKAITSAVADYDGARPMADVFCVEKVQACPALMLIAHSPAAELESGSVEPAEAPSTKASFAVQRAPEGHRRLLGRKTLGLSYDKTSGFSSGKGIQLANGNSNALSMPSDGNTVGALNGLNNILNPWAPKPQPQTQPQSNPIIINLNKALGTDPLANPSGPTSRGIPSLGSGLGGLLGGGSKPLGGLGSGSGGSNPLGGLLGDGSGGSNPLGGLLGGLGGAGGNGAGLGGVLGNIFNQIFQEIMKGLLGKLG